MSRKLSCRGIKVVILVYLNDRVGDKAMQVFMGDGEYQVRMASKKSLNLRDKQGLLISNILSRMKLINVRRKE